jgi:plasmid maintenance system antidote protein VapI
MQDVVTDLRMRVGRELGDWMRVEGLTSLRAAQQLGLSERTLSQLLNEQYCDLTVGELLKVWRSTGGDVEIVLRRPASG